MDENDLVPVEITSNENTETHAEKTKTCKPVFILFGVYLLGFFLFFTFLIIPGQSTMTKTINFDANTKSNFVKKSFVVNSINPETPFFDLKMALIAKNASKTKSSKINVSFTISGSENDAVKFTKGVSFLKQNFIYDSEGKTDKLKIFRNKAMNADKIEFEIVLFGKMKKIKEVELTMTFCTTKFVFLFYKLRKLLIAALGTVLVYTLVRCSEEEDNIFIFVKPLLILILGLFLFVPFSLLKITELKAMFRNIIEICIQCIFLNETQIIRTRLLLFAPFLGAFLALVPLKENLALCVYRMLLALAACVPHFTKKEKSPTEEERDFVFFVFGITICIPISAIDMLLPFLSEEVYQVTRLMLYDFIYTGVTLITVYFMWPVNVK